MKRTKIFSLALIPLLSASLLVGCGGGETKPNGNNAAPTTPKSGLTVAMVTDSSGIHDNSFNQAAWEGLTRAQNQLGVTSSYVESKRIEDYYPNLTTLVKNKTDLTWGIGFTLEEDVKKVALANSNAKIGFVDSNFGGDVPKNVVAVTFKENEGSFLMGVLAGKMTKSNKLGFIGGMKFELIERFDYGFRAGVKAVNPAATVTSLYADAFDKADMGKMLASQLYQSGADIVFHAAGATGDGLFKEAKERGKGYWAIGVDRDQYDMAPDNVLSSMVKRVDNGVYAVIEELQTGNFAGGTELVMGLKEDGVGYAPTTNKNTPEDVIRLMDEYRDKIIAGEIQVPATAEELKAFNPQ